MALVITAHLDKRLRSQVSRILTEKGYSISHCHDLDCTLKLLSANPADLLIFEIGASRQQARDFLRSIKKACNNLPILLVDSSGIMQDLQLAEELKACGVIRPPVSETEIAEAAIDICENGPGDDRDSLTNKKLKSKIEHLTLLNRVARMVNSTLEIEQLLKLIMSVTSDIFNAEASSILLKDDATGELYFNTATGEKSDTLKEVRIPPGTGIAGWVVDNGKPVIVDDLQNDERFYGVVDKVTAFQTKMMMAAPLKTKKKVVGVIEIINRKDGRKFTPKDLNLLWDLTHHISLAIENARLRQNLLDANARIESYNRDLEKEVEARTRELEIAQDQIIQSEKMASIGQLAAGVAHEINNPLGYINSNLKNLKDYSEVFRGLIDFANGARQRLGKSPALLQKYVSDTLGDELYGDIDFIRDDTVALIDEARIGCEKVKDIVLSLKSFARSGDAAIPELCEINSVIEEILRIVWNELKYKAEVEKDLGEIGMFYAYTEGIKQVIMNLLVNASQAIEEHGKISIKTRKQEDRVIIEISDTGKGIPPEIMSKIFEPFYTTKEVGIGTGLGLYISYNIIQKHNGRIDVDSKPGRGTTFTISLPYARRPEQLGPQTEDGASYQAQAVNS